MTQTKLLAVTMCHRQPRIAIFQYCLLLIVVFATLASSALAQYAEYKRESARTPALRILFTKKVLILESGTGENLTRESYTRKEVAVSSTAVTFGGKSTIDSSGFHIGASTLPLQEISTIATEHRGDTTILLFYRYSPAADSLTRSRKGNRTRFNEPLAVPAGDYCRGHLFSIAGNITVDGEVQKDVISLFGDIVLGASAVVRGDIAMIDGSVKIARQASVYGIVYYEKEKRKFLSQRHRDRNYFSWDVSFRYNRVDGAAPALWGRFDDPDSALPSLWVQYGYAFESERIRFKAGLDQPIYRATPVFVGAEMYQRLGSDDDRIIDDVENTFFALLVTEDFKDYYEARGGHAWVRIQDSGYWNISAEYRVEETRWFNARQNLFSLTGGDKRFLPNFGHAPHDLRDAGIVEIDTSTLADIHIKAEYDSRLKKEPGMISAWVMTAGLDWSDPEIGSSFDYRRYWGNLSRRQRLSSKTMITAHITGGASDGYLPLHRRFSMGGLGTVRGYRHKEFIGTRFWIANLEYKFVLPKTPLTLGLIYDIGQMANGVPLDRSVDVKHSIGANVYLIDDDFSLSIAHRLDGIDDPAVQLYARFSRSL
jgi:Omp85 superfamily domain